MTDTTSPLLKLLLMGTGNQENTWGEALNEQVFEPIEQAIAGYAEIAVNGGTDALTDEQRLQMVLEFVGTLAGAQIIEVDNLSKVWIVRNACTLAGFTLSFRTGTPGSATVIPLGVSLVWCDGDNNIYTNHLPTTAELLAANTLVGILNGLSAGIVVKTDASSWINRSVAAGTGLTASNGDGVAGNPTLSADIASEADAQAGTSSTKLMTPERTTDHFTEHFGDSIVELADQAAYDALTPTAGVIYLIPEE